jgi:hypothetical protein
MSESAVKINPFFFFITSFLGLRQARFTGDPTNNHRFTGKGPMSENQRDTAGRFLPGVNGRRTGVTVEARRTALLKLAKELAEKYPLADLEYAEGDPLAFLLYVIQRGFVPGVPEDEIKAIEELPSSSYEVKLAARAKLMADLSQRMTAVNILMPYLMPKLSSTEIKNTGQAAISSMADVAVNDPEMRDLLEKVALRQSKLRRLAAEAAAKSENAPGGE